MIDEISVGTPEGSEDITPDGIWSTGNLPPVTLLIRLPKSPLPPPAKLDTMDSIVLINDDCSLDYLNKELIMLFPP